ncbi:hypothetical protein RAS2_21370 [Phycisphaerae bacterium RAS2]|nr:hypothetical protein RAS2_21370 [Phycisphaerae bacterium RAS2]
MAKSKIELEGDCEKYYQHLAESRAAQESGDYLLALECAAKCLDFVDGMMRFERKYEEKEFRSVTAIDFILRIAPLFLCKQLLLQIEALLKSQRLIEKNTSQDLGDKLSEAWLALKNAYRLWNHLEQNPDSRQDELEEILGWVQEDWRQLCLRWEEFGLVYREPEGVSYRIRLRYPMREPTEGKCPACGETVKKPRCELLTQTPCDACGKVEVFVLVVNSASASV